VESIRPRVTSPVSVSNASKVICARAIRVKPGPIAIRAPSEAPCLVTTRESLADRRRPYLMRSLREDRHSDDGAGARVAGA
jgi:hypothetical protein